MLIRDVFVVQLLVTAVVLFLFVGSVAGIAVGVGLIVRSAGTLRFFGVMNRWVSTRRALEVLEAPRDLEATIKRHRRWVGAALITAGAVSMIGLVTRLDVARVVAVFGVDIRRYVVTSVIVETVGWFLILGSAAAVAIGIMLVFFPRALSALEARANRWISTRNLATGADAMHLPLDRLVEKFPRAAGWVIAAISLIAAIGSGSLLFGPG